MATPADQLKVGLKYRTVGQNRFGRPSSVTWQLDSIATAADGRRYAKLFQVGDPTLRKVVTATAILDRGLFEPVS